MFCKGVIAYQVVADVCTERNVSRENSSYYFVQFNTSPGFRKNPVAIIHNEQILIIIFCSCHGKLDFFLGILRKLAINEQPVAYYHESTVDDGVSYSITGRVPVLYNGDRAELVLEFTDSNPHGSVVGVRRIYTEGETETVAKTMDAVLPGDVIDFVCDYYSYEGEYIDSYMLGEQLVVEDELAISDVYVDEAAANLTYMFIDIYNQNYWTTAVTFE